MGELARGSASRCTRRQDTPSQSIAAGKGGGGGWGGASTANEGAET